MRLSEAGLQKLFEEKISIRVTTSGKQKLKIIPYLTVLVNNKTSDMQVYVNWDHSSLELHNSSNRVIRDTPNLPRDLTQSQIFTIEKNYSYNIEAGRMERAGVLVDLAQRIEFSQVTDPTTDEKNIQPLYTLDLLIGLKHVTESDAKLINLLLPFVFTLEIEPDQIALPPLRWLMRRVGRRTREEGSWFWGNPG